MGQREPRAGQRRGAISKVERDGSVTLYGVEDWTELRDVPVIKIVQHAEPAREQPDEIDEHIGDMPSQGDDD